MANFQELEVKILNIDVEKLKEKLSELGATYKNECVQKIYTYDCYSPYMMYMLMISDYKNTLSKNSLLKIANLYSQIEPVITETEKTAIEKICAKKTIKEYILDNINNIDISILENSDVLRIINEVGNRFFKWIRLRKNGEKVEFTIKYIYNTESQYGIEQVKEIEVNVSDFDIANKLIEEMGYYRKKLVEKKRTSYVLKDTKIEIDEWPLINPYVEIEGETENEIYEVVKDLGYKRENSLIMNTEDVYIMEGIDINSFEILTFDEQKII